MTMTLADGAAGAAALAAAVTAQAAMPAALASSLGVATSQVAVVSAPTIVGPPHPPPASPPPRDWEPPSPPDSPPAPSPEPSPPPPPTPQAPPPSNRSPLDGHIQSQSGFGSGNSNADGPIIGLIIVGVVVVPGIGVAAAAQCNTAKRRASVARKLGMSPKRTSLVKVEKARFRGIGEASATSEQAEPDLLRPSFVAGGASTDLLGGGGDASEANDAFKGFVDVHDEEGARPPPAASKSYTKTSHTFVGQRLSVCR